jgi:hypothetical protein
MTAFDAELYLRLAGERTLLGGASRSRGWWNDELKTAADALVAISAVERETAQRVVDDYVLASALREEGHAHHLAMRHAFHQGPHSQPTQPLRPRRVVACLRRIKHSAGTIEVRYISLGDDDTSVGVRIRYARSQSRRGGGTLMFGRGGPWSASGPPQLTLKDDRGTATSSDFSGGGSDSEWDGRYEAHTPLAKDTAWIEIDGERIELVEEPLPTEVRVEEFGDDDLAHRYLWHRLAVANHFHQAAAAVELAAEALLAAGALAADDPVLADIRAVAEAREEGRRSGRLGRQLPEPWSSLFARGRRANGPQGVLTVGAVSPEFDGTYVAVTTLESSREGFTAEVELTGALGGGGPFETDVGGTQIAWWAADDLGNHYLGEMAGWSSSGDHADGTIEFSPPLDRSASRLRLMPTTLWARCLIEFPLQWSKA